MKIVFRSTDISAQRKLIEETDLTLASAIPIMETYESLQKIADIFTETTGPSVQYCYAKRKKSQTLVSETQSAPSVTLCQYILLGLHYVYSSVEPKFCDRYSLSVKCIGTLSNEFTCFEQPTAALV